MPFLNKIRLPFFLSKPQYPVEEDVYVRGNGRRLVLHATISKELEGKTDWLPKEWHERLTIALRHDEVSIISQQFTGMFRISGTYEIEWIDFLNYPIAQAKFKGFEDGFSARSNLCNTCAESIQLGLVDDFINVEEGGSYATGVAGNDFIGCGTPVFEIAYINEDYVIPDTVTIDTSGNVSFVMQPTVATVSQIVLITYRVTCGAESATANVVGGVTGSAPACPMPVNVSVVMDENDAVPVKLTVTWEAPATPPEGYHWNMEKVSDGSLISTGGTDNLFFVVNALDFNTQYRLRLYGFCGTELSAPVVTLFTTPPKPSEELPHNEQPIHLQVVQQGSDIVVTASFMEGIPVKDTIYIEGKLIAQYPAYETRQFSFTVEPGDVAGQSFSMYQAGSYSQFMIQNTSVFPASSVSQGEDYIIDFIIVL